MIAALVSCVAMLLGIAIPANAQRAEPFPGLDAYVSAGLKAWGVPGLSLAIVRNDSIMYARGYGQLHATGRGERVRTRRLHHGRGGTTP